jgi:cytochrome c oxidase assembly factor CtaG/cytochrome c551/c552
MLKKFAIVFVLFGLCSATGASAHDVGEHSQTAAATIRSLEIALISLSCFAYAAGVLRIRREIGSHQVVRNWQVLSFAAAIGLFIFILSPQVDEVTDALFSAHMGQHLVLMLVIPPLLVWSRPVLVMLWALPRGWRKGFATSRTAQWIRWTIWHLMHPLCVAVLFLGTFSFWHLPRPYAWSLENEWVHTFEHLSFVVTALMFWTLVIEPSGRRRMSFIPTMLYVSAIAVLSGLPGALMILSPVVLFKAHGNAALQWGLTPLEDQQIAGLIMWVPAGIFFLIPIAWLFVKSLQDAERRQAIAHTTAALLFFAMSSAVLLCASPASAAQDDVATGKALIGQYGCGTCHTIPGIDNANGRVGPPLSGIADRLFIAGRLQNNVDNLVKWITNPQSVSPGTAMPNMGISRDDAAKIAHYLETLHAEP